MVPTTAPAGQSQASQPSPSDSSLSRTSPQPFRLLDLPPELLLQILALVVVRPEPICIHTAPPNQPNSTKAPLRSDDNDTTSPPPPQQAYPRILQPLRQPPITLANRLLRAEGLKLFYRRNVFHGVNWSAPLPRDWVARVDAARRGEMAVLVSSGWEAEDVGRHLRSAGLK